MPQAHVHSPVDKAAYLRGEKITATKHEFVGDEIHAMAGKSERLTRTAGKLFFHLRGATHSKPYRAFMTDMKPRVASSTAYNYPDAMLLCNPDDDQLLYKHSSCLIAKVLTPATTVVSAGEKSVAYREPASLRDNLLVDSERPCSRVFFRNEHDAWFEQKLSAENRVDVAYEDTRLTLDDVYDDTGLLVV